MRRTIILFIVFAFLGALFGFRNTTVRVAAYNGEAYIEVDPILEDGHPNIDGTFHCEYDLYSNCLYRVDYGAPDNGYGAAVAPIYITFVERNCSSFTWINPY